ncbi:MAG: hypothetical protein ABWX94_00870, partial [Candidatus Saccharimonadales bacterium]
MELPPTLPETGGDIYKFRHVDPINDLGLLHAVTKDTQQITHEWLEELDKNIATGSTSLNPSSTTTKVATEIRTARSKVISMLSPKDDHEQTLRKTLGSLKGDSSNVYSSSVYGSLKALHDITGEPLESLRKAPFLVAKREGTIQRHFRYIERVANKLGWNGDVHQLVKEHPRLLMISEKKITTIAWLAIGHGTAEQRGMSNAQVVHLVGTESAEAHIVACLVQDDYRFGNTINVEAKDAPARHVKDARAIILDSVTYIARRRRVGEQPLKSYMRYRPPKKDEVEQYKYSSGFLALTPPIERPKPKPELQKVNKVSGREP